MANKLMLVQDDCAPDSLEYFDEQLLEETEITRGEFIRAAIVNRSDEMSVEYRLNGYLLMFSCDDPFYRLYKGVE